MTYVIQKYKANRDGSDFYGACQLRFGFKNGSSSDYQKQFESFKLSIQTLKPIYQLYIRLQSFNDTVYFNDADYRIITICKWMAQCKQIYFDTCFKNFPSRIE